MEAIYEHKIVVLQSAIDTNMHVNNVVYVQWMQDAATAHSDSLGFTSEFYDKIGSTWVARSHFIEYLSPAFLGEELVVQTWISSIKRFSSNREYAFFRKSDKMLLARAKTVWIYLNANGKPGRIPDELLAKYIADESYEPKLRDSAK
ncbi:MAG: acyl-CoA thioesterase [Campylobacteraceae bacterium]|jgi:acyl-CoA thioester hydrolase|nr:acyl-CoA thioesterase [Campylobacteraceae bacterium]